jgi:5-hydroxyisourate hydrolase
MAGGISVHAVDITRGMPAEGMRVEVYALREARELLAEGLLAADGSFGHPIAHSAAAGTYEVLFHAGDYFRSVGAVTSSPPFLDIVPFRFTIANPIEHYHLPLKISPWGFSLFRGS